MIRSAFCSLLVLVIFSAAVAGRTVQFTLNNGMVIILKENHAAPLVAGIVYVRAGSKFESESNNGFTHFLEHLLFNGTTKRDRLAINEGIKDIGGYINAFTRKDLTAYLFVVPAGQVEHALDLQSDQLFNSTLPETEFPKERSIVIEEIRKDYDNPDYQAEIYFDSLIYHGTPFARPVLGPIDVIASIPRDTVLRYYREHYVPNNMIGLFIGDFSIPDFSKLVEKYYGSVKAGGVPVYRPVPVEPGYGDTIHIRRSATKNTHVHMVFPAPRFKEKDYYAYEMLARLLDSGESSPLYKRLTDRSEPLINEMSVYLETDQDFSLLHFNAIAAGPQHVQQIVSLVNRTFAEIADFGFDPAQLKRAVVRVKTESIYQEERLHYYGMLVASKIVNCGYAFLQDYIRNFSQVKPRDVQRVAGRISAEGKYLAMAVIPERGEDD